MSSNCETQYSKFGTFKINVLNNKRENFCYIIKGRKQSLSFFTKTTENLRKYCDDKRVVEEIEVLIIHNIEYAQPIGSGLEDEN
jgi:hypothetical protein